MNTPQQLAAALGVGFYRYWHVPAPGAVLDIRDTRRADLSVIGPAALALLALGTWIAGRMGTALLLDERVTAPLESLPWTARLLVFVGVLGLLLALAWWLGTAPLRARVARGVGSGCVARIPDDPPTATQPLHAAASQLGRTLRDLPDPTPAAEPAFVVLRTASSVLADEATGPLPDVRRLRRRCLVMAERLDGSRSGSHADTGQSRHVAAGHGDGGALRG